MMQTIARDLESLVQLHASSLRSLSSDTLLHKPLPDKWSKQEIVGHLIDSAQNNIRRFLVAQYEENPTIVYNQDKWVTESNYQNRPSQPVIELCILLNNHLCEILQNIPADATQRVCTTQATHTLEWLAEDYVKHFKHHLHQVLDLEPFPYN